MVRDRIEHPRQHFDNRESRKRLAAGHSGKSRRLAGHAPILPAPRSRSRQGKGAWRRRGLPVSRLAVSERESPFAGPAMKGRRALRHRLVERKCRQCRLGRKYFRRSRNPVGFFRMGSDTGSRSGIFHSGTARDVEFLRSRPFRTYTRGIRCFPRDVRSKRIHGISRGGNLPPALSVPKDIFFHVSESPQANGVVPEKYNHFPSRPFYEKRDEGVRIFCPVADRSRRRAWHAGNEHGIPSQIAFEIRPGCPGPLRVFQSGRRGIHDARMIRFFHFEPAGNRPAPPGVS